jgi:hypothetical protein
MPRDLFNPQHTYRMSEAKSIFGFSGVSTLRNKIASGDIPTPHLLSKPPSRARGWWGWQLNEWADHVEKQQDEWAAATTDIKVEGTKRTLRYVPKGGDLSKRSAPTTATKPKVKKVKLIPPRKAKG